VMTTPLLEGLDGVEKMSKSLGNYVGVTDEPGEMFGKLMSISDELMWRYYGLLTDMSRSQIDTLKTQVSDGGVHPKQAKVDLAKRIVGDFHDSAAAEAAAAEFERVHARGELPSDLQTFPVDFAGEANRALSRIMVEAKLAASTSEASRKIQQGGVRVNGDRVEDIKRRIEPRDLPLTLQVGRLAVRLESR
jgi:tyrosyl-tRNA synthetase